MYVLGIFVAGMLLTMEALSEHLVEFVSNYQTNSQVKSI